MRRIKMKRITKEIKSALKMLKKIERLKRKEDGATKSKEIKHPQTKSNYQQGT
jgi:hypothetical protein